MLTKIVSWSSVGLQRAKCACGSHNPNQTTMAIHFFWKHATSQQQKHNMVARLSGWTHIENNCTFLTLKLIFFKKKSYNFTLGGLNNKLNQFVLVSSKHARDKPKALLRNKAYSSPSLLNILKQTNDSPEWHPESIHALSIGVCSALDNVYSVYF